MAIYVYTDKFIREPWEDTVAYYPFKEDFDDHSWNWNILSNTQYLNKQTLWYNWIHSVWPTTPSIWLALQNNNNVKFISLWCKVNTSSWVAEICRIWNYGSSCWYTSHIQTDLDNKFTVFTNTSFSRWAISNWLSFNAWHHVTIWYDWSKIVISKDWIQETLYNGSWYNFDNEIRLCWLNINWNVNFTLSEVILESKVRTAQEISDYFNGTKSKYGIS